MFKLVLTVVCGAPNMEASVTLRVHKGLHSTVHKREPVVLLVFGPERTIQHAKKVSVNNYLLTVFSLNFIGEYS